MKDINNCLTFIIRSIDEGQRLDQASCRLLGSKISRAQVQRLIIKGRLLLDNSLTRPAVRVKAGQLVKVSLPEPEQMELCPEPINFKVLYEDEYLIVVNKPSGLVVHPAAGHTVGTLVHGLLYHCNKLADIGGNLRPGIVHRLDKDTSGALVAAKCNLAYQGLVAAFASGRVIKEYLALVWNFPPEKGEINLGIGRHPIDRKRMSTTSTRIKAALSSWRVVSRFASGISLLRVRIYTGRTHQIRVHFSEAGWPLVGDPLYGYRYSKRNKLVEKELIQLIKHTGRQFLHSVRLSFEHPITKLWIEIDAPLPSDFRIVLGVVGKEKINI